MNKKNKKASFTVIELLVVIAIIGLLASVILVSLTKSRGKAREKSALQFSSTVYHALGADLVAFWNFDDPDNLWGKNGTNGNPVIEVMFNTDGSDPVVSYPVSDNFSDDFESGFGIGASLGLLGEFDLYKDIYEILVE